LSDLIEDEPLTGDHTEFFAQLEMRMDVRQVLREMAAETALITNDNFSQGSTNFAYYEHPTRGFIVLPWDLDSIIAPAPVDADLYDYKGVSDGSKLRELMNQNPTWRAQFTDDLVDIRENIMTRVPELVDAVCTQIQGAVRDDPNRTSSTEDFQSDCAAVRQAVIDRIAATTTILGR
jgi:spore coat protein CotH